MKQQVSASYYEFSKYVSKEQFSSYLNQIGLILSKKCNTILEIGVGGKIIEKLLPPQISYTSYDIGKDLEPTVVGNIEQLPFKDNAYDLVVCFEVLEHLPYETFVHNLTELARVSKGDVTISLPYANNKISFSFFLPIIHHHEFTILIPKFYRKHNFDGLHYWEIGKSGYSMKRIKKDLQQVFEIMMYKTYKDNTYHTFFDLRKRESANEQ